MCKYYNYNNTALPIIEKTIIGISYLIEKKIMPPLLTQVARLSDGLPLVATITGAPGIPVTAMDQKEAKDLLRKITAGANKMSIVSGDKVFYYMTRESLCFLTMTEAKYPKRMGFLYLDEVCDLILQELVRDHGNNVSKTYHLSQQSHSYLILLFFN